MSPGTTMIIYIFLAIAFGGSRADEIRDVSLQDFSVDAVVAETTVHTAPVVEGHTEDPYKNKRVNGETRGRGEPILHSGFQASHYPPAGVAKIVPSTIGNAAGSPPRRKTASDKSQYFSSPSNYRLSHQGKIHPRGTNFSPYGEAPSFPKFKAALPGPGAFPGAEVSPAKRPESVYRLVKNFEAEPVFLARNYHDYSGADFPKNRHFRPQAKEVTGYAPESVTDRYGPRIVPIRAPGSSPRIPQYQATSVGQPLANDYEKLANQPQLHFTTNSPAQAGTNGLPIYHSNPYDRIRNDVELINQKATTTPRPYDIAQFDRFFKTTQPSFPSLGQTASPPKLQNLQLPSSNLFDTYDQIFGKYSKLASEEGGRENLGSRHVTPKIEPEDNKPEYRSAERDDESDEVRSGNDDDDDDRSASSTEYPAPGNNRRDKNSNESYEDDETRRNERQGSYEEADDDRNDESDEDENNNKSRSGAGSYESKPATSDEDHSGYYKSYSPDFDKEFEDSYNQDIPKEEFVHVKEVPEVEEDPSESKSSLGTSWTSNKDHRSRSRQYRVSSKPSRSEKNRARVGSKNGDSSDDSEGFGSSQETSQLLESKPRESYYGRKVPRGDRGSKKFHAGEISSSFEKSSRKKAAKPRVDEKQNKSEKLSKTIRGERAQWKPAEDRPETKNPRNSSSKRPKIDEKARPSNFDAGSSTYASFRTSESRISTSSARPTIEQLQTFTFPPFDPRRPTKKPSQDDNSHPATKIHDSPKISSTADFYSQGTSPGYLTDRQILRDLTGI